MVWHHSKVDQWHLHWTLLIGTLLSLLVGSFMNCNFPIGTFLTPWICKSVRTPPRDGVIKNDRCCSLVPFNSRLGRVLDDLGMMAKFPCYSRQGRVKASCIRDPRPVP